LHEPSRKKRKLDLGSKSLARTLVDHGYAGRRAQSADITCRKAARLAGFFVDPDASPEIGEVKLEGACHLRKIVVPIADLEAWHPYSQSELTNRSAACSPERIQLGEIEPR